jgi:hypothetical protein
MNYFRERTLSQPASDLIQFDADSIRQLAASQHQPSPDVWLVDPDAYEKSGRILRDTDFLRMLAYSKTEHTLYGTDGCNSCTRQVRTNLELLPADELKEFAIHNEMRVEMLEHLASLLR